MRASAVLSLLLPVFLGACTLFDGSDDAAPLLRTDRSVYAPGDTIEAIVSNNTGRSLFFENCCGPLVLHIEQWQDGAWVTPYFTGCAALCLSVPAEIRPGERRTARLALPPATDGSGPYRLTVRYWLRARADAVGEQAVSPSFNVQ